MLPHTGGRRDSPASLLPTLTLKGCWLHSSFWGFSKRQVIQLILSLKALWGKCIVQYFSSFIQVNEQSQSKSASGTTCQNPETKRAMKLYLSLRKISPIHLRRLCLGNLWKNVCCSITQTMEILDKENDCVARNAPYAPLKSLNMYIFSNGYITIRTAGKSTVENHFP